MRHARAVVLLVLAVLLFSPTAAFAQWNIIRWIQELSGPGPFEVNYGLDINVLCVPKENTKRAEGTDMKGHPREYRWLFCDQERFEWRNVQRYYGFAVGVGDGENNLVFPDGVTGNPKVRLYYFAARGAWRPYPLVDVGALAGMHRFSARPGVVVSRFILDPYISLRPFGLVGKNERDKAKDILARLIEFNVGVTIYPEGFKVEDFGAISTKNGTLLSGNAEAIPHVGLRILFAF